MHIWIVNLKPDDISKKEIKDYFFSNNISAMGWRFKEETLTREQYLARAEKEFIGGYQKACENYFRMEKGDLCLANNGVTYYIGTVADESPFYAKVSKYDRVNEEGYRFSWCRCVQWYPIGRQDQTPAVIVAAQSSRNQKTIDIRHENDINHMLYRYCRCTFNVASGTQRFPVEEKVDMTAENFAQCMSAQELEDLVGLYLQEKFNYIFFPSSCKTATKDFEYIMLHSDRRQYVYTQVKQNATISVRHYAEGSDYKDCVVYLFSNLGYKERECATENIRFLDKRELFLYFYGKQHLFQTRLKFDSLIYNLRG